MHRVCIIDVAGLSPGLARRDGSLLVHSMRSGVRGMATTFPAVTASVQASMTTGAEPGAHGVVSGGLFRRQCKSVSLSERSNTLLAKKRFWRGRHLPAQAKAAMLFWSNPLAGAAEVVLGSSSYASAGPDIAESPRELYRQLVGRLGPSQFEMLHGPQASWRVSQWIAKAAQIIWQEHAIELMWVYLPGVDFELVRHGLDSEEALAALREIDRLVRRLADQVASDGGDTFVVSDGAYAPVQRVAAPNVQLRRAGLLQVIDTPEGQQVDYENSRAFAMVDHQFAHIYCLDETAADEAAGALRADAAIAAVPTRDELFAPGLGHDRAGERIALAAADAWLDYRWWDDQPPAKISPMRCGYDPCQLFEDTRRPELVLASRGLVGADAPDQALLAATCELPDRPLKVTDLPELVLESLFGREAIAAGERLEVRG